MGFNLINTREDLDALAGTPEHDDVVAMLIGSLWRLEKDDVAGTWRAVEDDSTIVRFGFTRADFPGATAPALPLYVAPPSPASEAISKIDADTDAIYGAVLGNRAEEYTLAATDAQAYKAAGYGGAAPSSVQSWATARCWTATQAADDILATATEWRSAQAAIRAARLDRKEQVRTATDAAGVTMAMTEWAEFVAYMRGQLGV